MASVHPLDPLQPEEITKTARIVRDAFRSHRVNFRVITLQEPPKSELAPFLTAEHSGQQVSSRPGRRAMVHALVSDNEGKTRFLVLRIDLDKSKVIHQEHITGRHSYIDAEYMKAAEQACLADKRVQQQIAALKLPKNATVVVEPWAYATDGMSDMSQRVTMCWFYLRISDHPDSNYYAYPLDVCAEISEKLEVTTIYRLPSKERDRISHNTKLFDHAKIHENSEYHPNFVRSRESTQPYQVVQPRGPSFSITGNHVSWEKWTFRVGFNYREGMTIHDVRFDDRSIFYRLSLAEMFVPYGDTRSPYQRKGAFDLGNDGAGINANNLQLGCDCLGHIKYFDGWHNTSSGEPLRLPNVVCCHEVDDGVLWKHTNFRTNNPVVARSRVLVLQTIVTVTNYEYIFAFHFKQDASIHYEVRATGILSTAPIDLGDSVSFGTLVAPGVMAPYHQHLFSLRIDPAVEGRLNSFVVDETVPVPIDRPPFQGINQFGVGFNNQSRIIEREDHFDLDHTKNRAFKIVNELQLNLTTGTPVGYQLVPHYSQNLLADPTSFHARRAEFAAHSIWVTRYADDELFPAGTYTMQSSGGEGIASWIRKRKGLAVSKVRNEDLVVWHTFGSTHIPRIEDWPVMPCEKMGVTLKPVNFFERNPAIDVAVARQEVNRSVLVTGSGGVKNGHGDEECCETPHGNEANRDSWNLV